MALQIASLQKRTRANRVGIPLPWPLVSLADYADCLTVLACEPGLFFTRPRVVEAQHLAPFPAVLPKLAEVHGWLKKIHLVAFADSRAFPN